MHTGSVQGDCTGRVQGRRCRERGGWLHAVRVSGSLNHRVAPPAATSASRGVAVSAKLGVAQAHPGAGEAWRRQQNGSAPQAGKPRISGGNLMAWANNSPGHGGHRPLTYRGSLGSRRAPPTTQKERKHNPGTAPLLTTHNSPPITIRPPHAHARVFRECTRPQTGRMRRGRGGGGRGRARFGVWRVDRHSCACGRWGHTLVTVALTRAALR